MCEFSWTIGSSLYQITDGEPDSYRTRDAKRWLYATIQAEVSARHPIILGAIAEMTLDRLIKAKGL